MKQSKERIAYFYQLIGECVEKLAEVKHHAVYEHEYKTNEQLKTRIALDKTVGASCFAKDIDVQEMMEDMIYDSIELIPWLASEEKIFRIVESRECCGKKFLRTREHNWEDGAIICNSVVLLLEKEYDKYGCITGIHVLTCYPE